MSQGPVYLMAGAGPRTSRRAVRYHQDLLKHLGKPRPRIAYVGAAANDNRAFAMLVRSLVLGVAARVVNVELTRARTSTDAIRQTLAGADLVFFTGGDVDHGMRLINQRDLAPCFRQLSAQGMPMEGISAGSILLGRHWVRFDDEGHDASATVFPCLGVVPHSFDTHSEDDDWCELRTLAHLLGDGGEEREVYGIPSGGCAIFEDGALRSADEELVRVACRHDER